MKLIATRGAALPGALVPRKLVGMFLQQMPISKVRLGGVDGSPDIDGSPSTRAASSPTPQGRVWGTLDLILRTLGGSESALPPVGSRIG